MFRRRRKSFCDFGLRIGLGRAGLGPVPLGVATLLVRASQIGGDRLPFANDGCSIFEAVVWTLIYLKPSSDEGPKSIRGLNMSRTILVR